MIEIKIYSEIYKEEVAQLILGIQRTEFEIPITLEEQPDLNDIKKFYQHSHGNFWVAVIDNRVVGTIALLAIGNELGNLRKMFVDSAYRGKNFNIGQKLLDHLLDWSKQKKYKAILLGTTEKFIAAQRFYEKNGFFEVEKDTLPAEFPIMKVDVKFYKYILVN